MSQVIAAKSKIRGFDCNTTLSLSAAKTMRALGYCFALRYVGREIAHVNDLSAAEVQALHEAGLAVMPVQHVASETAWSPTGDNGNIYGCNAGAFACAAGIGSGTVVWCDLEGVAPGTAAADVDAYCRAWYRGVAAAGFTPGLYVGWHCVLSPAQLYALPFQHYWAAYNLDADREPSIRGCSMRQHLAQPNEDPLRLGLDTDMISGDRLGGVPLVFAPDGWP